MYEIIYKVLMDNMEYDKNHRLIIKSNKLPKITEEIRDKTEMHFRLNKPENKIEHQIKDFETGKYQHVEFLERGYIPNASHYRRKKSDIT